MNELRNDKNLYEAVSRKEQKLPSMPADLNERLMESLTPNPSPRGEGDLKGEGEHLLLKRVLKRPWIYGSVAIAASLLLLIMFNFGNQQTPQEPLVAQQMAKQTVAPSRPVVEAAHPEIAGIRGRFSDPIFDENGITEPSPDSQEPTVTEKVETPRHFTPRPVIDITSPKDEPFFLASTSYMAAPKSHRNGIAEESAEPENGSATQLPTNTTSQSRPQVPSIKENFHKLTKKERRQVTVLGAIDRKRWHIDITTMNTMRYGSRAVTPDFYLELRGDTLRSYLPYLGQAYQSPTLSPAIGLNFEESVLQYKESKPKSNKYTQIGIDVRTREDTYHYVIDIYDSGEATIRVRSLNRDPVSFDGTMEINQ